MTKIEALKKTIYNLENEIYQYNWHRYESCNCGVLAKTLLGGGKVFTNDIFDHGDGSGMSGTFDVAVKSCEITGLQLPAAFKALKDTGFTYEELHKLESCTVCTTDKPGLIKYLKAWVKILESEAPKKEVKQVIRYVSVPETIKELEIIQN